MGPLISRIAATRGPGTVAEGISAAMSGADVAAEVTAIAHSRTMRSDEPSTVRTLLPTQTGWQLDFSAVCEAFLGTSPPWRRLPGAAGDCAADRCAACEMAACVRPPGVLRVLRQSRWADTRAPVDAARNR